MTDQEKLVQVIKDVTGEDLEKLRKETLETMKKNEEEFQKKLTEAKLKKEVNKDSTVSFSKFAVALAKSANKGLSEAVKIAKDEMKDEFLSKALEKAIDLQRHDEFANGGVLVPSEQDPEFIELLRNETVVKKMGSRVKPLPIGGMNVLKQVSGSNFKWSGNVASTGTSVITYGTENMRPRFGGTTVGISENLLQGNMTRSIEQDVQNDIVREVALATDAVALRGEGGEHQPKGILNRIAADNKIDVSSLSTSPTFLQVNTLLADMIYRLKKQNIPMTRMGWIMSPRTELFLKQLLSNDGIPIFMNDMKQGMLWGMPYMASNQIPENLGSGSDESELYLVDFDQVVIGETPMRMRTSTEGTVKDNNGNMISALDLGLVFIKVTVGMDIMLKYDQSAVVATGVKFKTSL